MSLNELAHIPAETDLASPMAHLAFINMHSTNAAAGITAARMISQRMFRPGESPDITYVSDIPSTEHFLDYAPDTLVTTHGGDGTIRGVEAAILGVVANDPETTAANFDRHRDIARRTILFAAAGGNANNLPLSAMGKASVDPTLIDLGYKIIQGEKTKVVRNADVKTCYPLRYAVLDSEGNNRLSNIAVTGMGLGVTALAAIELEKGRSRLRTVSEPVRLGVEAGVSMTSTLQARPFSLDITMATGTEEASFESIDLAMLELINSSVYAKRARSSVNIDDTNLQIATMHTGRNKLALATNAAIAMTQLGTGRYPIKHFDLSGLTLKLRNSGDTYVPFHADGELHSDQVLFPDETLVIKLAKLGVRTIVANH